MAAMATAEGVKTAVTGLMRRAHAWWEGEDLPPAPPLDPALEQPPEHPPEPETRALSREETITRLLTEPAEAAALQLLYGLGRAGPGDEEGDVRHFSSLALTPSATLAWLGPGLGAPVAAVARATGSFFEGAEWRGAWIGPSRAHLAATGSARRTKIDEIDPAQPVLKPNRLDAAVSLERLYEIENPRPLLNAAAAALRPGGLALFTEPVLEDGVEPKAVADAFAGPAEGLRTSAAWEKLLESAGLEMRASEDVTGSAIARYQAGRAQFPKVLGDVAIAAKLDGSKPALLAFAKEAAAVTRRLAALERGDLAVYRFLAAKPNPAD